MVFTNKRLLGVDDDFVTLLEEIMELGTIDLSEVVSAMDRNTKAVNDLSTLQHDDLIKLIAATANSSVTEVEDTPVVPKVDPPDTVNPTDKEPENKSGGQNSAFANWINASGFGILSSNEDIWPAPTGWTRYEVPTNGYGHGLVWLYAKGKSGQPYVSMSPVYGIAGGWTRRYLRIHLNATPPLVEVKQDEVVAAEDSGSYDSSRSALVKLGWDGSPAVLVINADLTANQERSLPMAIMSLFRHYTDQSDTPKTWNLNEAVTSSAILEWATKRDNVEELYLEGDASRTGLTKRKGESGGNYVITGNGLTVTGNNAPVNGKLSTVPTLFDMTENNETKLMLRTPGTGYLPMLVALRDDA